MRGVIDKTTRSDVNRTALDVVDANCIRYTVKRPGDGWTDVSVLQFKVITPGPALALIILKVVVLVELKWVPSQTSNPLRLHLQVIVFSLSDSPRPERVKLQAQILCI